ncbi:hypothetical protein EPN52_13530 [bacterium]|nr:MAG: hypothetical protein EPN52_13530 [bacterium]
MASQDGPWPEQLILHSQRIKSFAESILTAEVAQSQDPDLPLSEEALKGYRELVKMVKDFYALAREHGVNVSEAPIRGRVNLVVMCEGCGGVIHQNINVALEELDEIGLKYNLSVLCQSCGTKTRVTAQSVEVRGYTPEEIERARNLEPQE